MGRKKHKQHKQHKRKRKLPPVGPVEPVGFAAYLTAQGLAPSTVRRYVAIAARWADSLDPERYLAEMSGPDTPEGTVVSALAAAKHWIRWSGAPPLTRRFKWQKARQFKGVVLTRAQALELLQHCDKSPGRRFAELVVETGFRGNTIASITPEAAASIVATGRYDLRAKGGVLLTAPMTRRGVKLVRKLLKSGAFPVKEAALRAQWRATRATYSGAFERIDRVTLHTFRHTFGTSLIARGANLHTVANLMGHRAIQSTERYVHHVGVSAAVDLLE